MLYFIKQQKNPISAYAKIRPYRKVLVAGLEPARSCPRGILSPLRLPIPPHQHGVYIHQSEGFSLIFGGIFPMDEQIKIFDFLETQ